jgi:hypothetical protein
VDRGDVSRKDGAANEPRRYPGFPRLGTEQLPYVGGAQVCKILGPKQRQSLEGYVNLCGLGVVPKMQSVNPLYDPQPRREVFEKLHLRKKSSVEEGI